MIKAVGKRMCGAPEPGAPAPATGHSPSMFPLTSFMIDFLRFEVHFSCSVWVLRRDSISAHVWYGLRTNLSKGWKFYCDLLSPDLIFYCDLLLADFTSPRIFRSFSPPRPLSIPVFPHLSNRISEPPNN